MSSPPWLLRLAGRHLVPLLLLVFALLTIGWRYQQQMGAIVTDVARQETARLRERLSIDQNRLDVRMGLNDALFLRRLVGALALHEGLSHAYLIGPGGKVEASLSRLDLQRPFTEVLTRAGVPPALAGLQAAVLPRAIEVTPQGAGLALSGAVPLQGGHRLLVWVDNAHAVAVRRAAVQTELLRESVLVLVAVAALALLLHLLWFRRAQRLAGALGAMGAGDLSARTGLQGRDELALIGEAADRMAGQLHQEQERLRHMNDLINRSPAVVIEWLNQPGWPVVQVSESVRQWGYEPEQLLQGRVHYSDLIHPDDRLRIHAEVAEHFAHGPDEYRQTYRIRCADGRWAWVDERTTLSRDVEGQVVGISGVLLDVSAQRDAEQAQQEQAELLRMFYELPFLGMAISSPTDKRWLQVNDRLCEILGYPRDELLRMSWAQMTPPGDLERNVALFDELIAGLRNGYRMAKRFVRKDGRIVHAEIDVRAVRDAAGSVKRLFATIQDVTERQAAEAALQRSQEQLEEAQRIGRMGSWDYDLRTGVVAWSDETFRIQEIEPDTESASFEVFLDLIHPDDRARVAETYQRSVEQHTPYETRYRIVTRSGRTRYLHVRGETQYEQGQPVRSIGMVLDETELVETQRERDRLASVLETTADIVSMADPQGRVFYFNRAGYDMMGLSADTPLDNVIQRVHPPWAAQLVHDEGIPTAIREGRWLGETAVFNAQGREVPMSQLIMAHRGADGQVDYLWTILRDVSDSKAAEAALDRERAQLADAQAVAHVGSWIVQMPGGELTWSDEHYRVLGFEPRSVTPSLETFLSVVHPDDRPRVLAQVEYDMQRRTPGFSRTEHRVVTPHGIRHVEERANVEIDEQGEVFRIIGTTMDITERVQAGEALRRSEQRYTLAAQIGRSGAWEIWPEEGRVYYDENLSRLLGYAADELSEYLADWVGTVPEDARPRVEAAMQAVIEGRSDRYVLEHPVRRKDGSIGWVSVHGQRVSAPGEKPMRMVGSSSDITERVLAEQALREAKDMLEQGEAVGHLGSFAYDSHTGELRWSRQAFATIGLPWAPRPPSIDAYCACIHPDDAPRVRASIDLLVAGAEVPEVRFRTHPERGPVRWLRRLYQRIDRSAQGLRPRYIGTLQDITEIRKAEEKLRQVNRELEHRVTERTAQLRQANQELEAFSYTVSHDLKAPLRGIDGYSQLLMEEYGPKLDEDGRQFVQRIRHGVQLMGDLINDLLEYSRMERRDMTRDPVALVPLVQQVLDGYESDIRRLGVQVQTELEPFTLALDREGIAVVLRNLIGNALKFSRDRQPPQLGICSRSEAGRRILWVRDNGVGFDMKYHDRMFGIFQRLHRAEEFPGTGVGLALVFKAVQRMGGRVWAESSPGAGATFFLEFPE